MGSRDVTLDDVAVRSGVSRAAASRALNNRAGVRPDVRDHVRQVAADLGYRPNRAAQTLAGKRSSVIGVVLQGAGVVRTPYISSILEGLSRAAEKSDLGLLLLYNSDKPNVSVSNLLSDGLISGVIISIAAARQVWVEDLLEANVPCVLIGQPSEYLDVPCVDVECLEASAAIVGHLLDTGCERVATITGPLDRLDARHRYEGYLLAHTRRSIEVDEQLVISGDYTMDTGYRIANQLLKHKIDGLFAANDQMALGFYRAAMEEGLAVPEDISIAGFDGDYANDFSWPRVTSVAQPYRELSTMAVEYLIELMNGSSEVSRQLVEPKLFFGSTTR